MAEEHTRPGTALGSLGVVQPPAAAVAPSMRWRTVPGWTGAARIKARHIASSVTCVSNSHSHRHHEGTSTPTPATGGSLEGRTDKVGG